MAKYLLRGTCVAILSGALLTTHAAEEKWKASALDHKDSAFSGFYTGLSGGLDSGRAKTTTSGQSIGGINVNNSINLSPRGGSLGGFLGYGKVLSGIYIGGEIEGEVYGSSDKASTLSADGVTASNSVTGKKTNSISAAIRVGKPLDERTLVYLKGGIASNNYKIGSSVTSTANGGFNASPSQSTRLTQVIAGIGAERKLMEITPRIGLHVGAEYQHTFARDINVNLTSNTFSGATKFSPSSDAVKARLIFKF